MQKSYVSSQWKNKSGRISRLLSGFVFVVALAGLVLAVLFIGQNQDLRRRASGSSQVQLSLGSSVVDNNHLRIDVLVNTGGFSLAALDLRGTLTGMNASDVSIQNGTTLALTPILDKLTQGTNSVSFQVVRFASADPNATTTTHGQSVFLVSFVVANPKNNQAT